MDAVTFITKLQKFIRDSYQNIGDAMISGTVDSMEKYKYMQGQANAYQTVIQEIPFLSLPDLITLFMMTFFVMTNLVTFF